MSSTRSRLDARIDYKNFQNWYTGLATMMIVQAVSDLDALGDREIIYRDGSALRRSEVLHFLNSRWVEFITTTLGADAVRGGGKI